MLAFYIVIISFYALRVSQFPSFANKEAEKGIEILTQKFLDYLRQKEHLSYGLIRRQADVNNKDSTPFTPKSPISALKAGKND